ncbi:cysteine protease [Stylonychia lemnae]|uniref:Cysteine protease n=1 Tax=Stylonychia lemnae TaxID=5949 RepID=A0A078AJQ6_STYLE|nr:cysteine protease [Stylonychia lemnae]|eukprot:CDW81043.1 cysteine protease [Stylonychia lemnae]
MEAQNFLQIDNKESEHHIQKEFIAFIAKFGKTYSSKDAHQTKYEVFKQNYKKMQEHNDQQKGYELGINKFSDMTEEEFLSVFAKLKEDNDEIEHLKNRKYKLEARPHHFNTNSKNETQENPNVEIPKEIQIQPVNKDRYHCNHDEESHYFFNYNDYDYIDSLPKCKSADWIKKGMVGIPKDQSTCGSCWAHSALASIETLYAQENQIKEREQVPSFSEQQLVDCNFLPNLGCIGGRRQFAFNYTMTEGLTLAQYYPYKNRQGECQYNAQENKTYQIDAFKVYEKINNEDMEKLVCQGTVSISIRINDCIKSYKSGILHDNDGSCGCSKVKSGNHAVAIVGFGTDENAVGCKDYWIIKNSWGPKWGEDGFFRLCREDKQIENGTCNIRQEPMIAIRKNVPIQ